MTTVGPQAREQRESDTDELADLDGRRGSWDAVTEAWHAATSGRDWVAAQHATGLLGWARVTEATDGGTPAILAGLPVGHGYSGNGWHVHVHALLCFPADLSAEYVSRRRSRGRHARPLGGEGARSRVRLLRGTRLGPAQDSPRRHRQRARLPGQAGPRDHVRASQEGKRRGGRTPMQLLADAVETYRVEDVARWWEWEAAAEGRRQLEWSRGARSLRALAGLGTDRTDQEVAEDDTLDGEERLGLPPDTWSWMRAHDQGPALLDAAETDGLHGARRWLAGYGLDWDDVPLPRSLA